MLLSSQVVNAYAAAAVPGGQRPLGRRGRGAAARRARLELSRESPTRASSPTRRTPPANVILTNGARLYVDHAHPEYSSPEVTTPLDAVRGTGRVSGSCSRRCAGLAGAPGCPA